VEATFKFKDVLFTIKGRAFKPSLSLLVLLSAIVNGGMTYLVPLIADVGLPQAFVQPLQGFSLIVLNALLLYLSTEQSQTQARRTEGPA